MKTILFINGCVREKNSRSLKIAHTYIEQIKKTDDYNIVELNLSQENLIPLTSKHFDLNTGDLKPENIAYAKDFANADEIIVAAPFWEFLFPSIVGIYFEMVSIPEITFKYTFDGSVGLCKANSLTYIYTAGDFIKEEDKLSELYFKKLSNLYGIENFKAISATGLDIDPSKADDIVDVVCSKL